MGKSNVAAEEGDRRSDCVASASQSLIRINSIAIDITCAMGEIEPPAHDHFSLRGYVAGMREQNRRICLPFSSDDELVDGLPPLSVPKYRWWQCPSCVPEGNNVGGEKDSLCLQSKQRIVAYAGEVDWSRDFRNRRDNIPSNKTIKYSPSCAEGHNSTTCSEEKIDVTNNKDGNPCACISTKPFQNKERHNNDADAPDMVGTTENPSIRVDEPAGVDSPLPHRRKRKLRSLADIMEEEKNLKNEHPRTRSALSNGSAEVEAHSDPQLQLDVPVGVAKGMRSSPRKRKICPDEDRGPREITYPNGTAKRSKGLILDAETTCNRTEIPDMEAEGDASTPSDRRPSARSQQIKPKKNKALDMSGKVRRAHVDNRTVPVKEVPQTNNVHSVNSHKRAVNAETSFSYMESYFKSFLSGQKVDRVSGSSRRAEVEAIHGPLMSSRKSVVGDRNVHGVVTLDLSLNSSMNAERNSDDKQASCQQHSVIPDLNVSFTEKPSAMQEKQWSNFPENGSSTLNKNLNMSASCSREMIKEGKRQWGVSEPQPIRSMDRNLEREGPLDDIPMEIVELLAKNQRERALQNSRKNLLPEVINNSIRGTPVYMDMTNFPFKTTSGTSGKTGFDQGTLNFTQVKNPQFGIGNLEDSQRFRLFDSHRPSQQKKPQYTSSNSVLSEPRHSKGADLLWPPRRKNVPFHLSTDENRSIIQSNGLDLHPFSNQCYKGKAIADLKGCEKKAMYSPSAVKEGRIGSSSKSLDAYSNDAIPAMQLLSLMDRGIASGSSSIKVGSSNGFLDKRFSPCSHHPRLNGNEKQINDSFLSASFFSQSSHTKDFSPLLNGVCFSGASLKKPSYVQGQLPPQQGNSKNIDFAGPSNLVIHQSRGEVALGDCTLNRNPADFSTPDARNEYTISYKDLKPRKRNSSRKEGSRSANVESSKRQRMRKDDSSK